MPANMFARSKSLHSQSLRPRALLTGLMVGAICLTAAPTQAEDVTNLILATVISPRPLQTAPDHIPYSYRLDVKADEKEGSESRTYGMSYRVDPSGPEGARLTPLHNNEQALSKDDKEEIVLIETSSPAELAEEFWCGFLLEPDNIGSISPEGFTVISQNDTQAVLSLSSDHVYEMMQEDGDERSMSKKLAKNMRLEITVGKPDLDIRHFSLKLTKPTRLMAVAKMKKMNIEASCALAPNGYYYTAQTMTQVEVSVLGKVMAENSVITQSGLTPLP